MACGPADTAASMGTRTREKNVRIIGFRTPEWLVPFPGIAVEEREIQVTMENVSARQKNISLQIERRFQFDRQRAITAGSHHGFDRI